MKTLIHSIEELQRFLKVDSTFIVSSLFPYQEQASEKYLRSILGDDLMESLITWYNTIPDDEDEEDSSDLVLLLPYAQNIIAKFAFFLGAPNLDLKLTDAGFGVVSNQNLAPASKERVNRFVSALESDGWDAVEILLRFLENHEDDYPQWTESSAYTMQLRNYINSAEEFDRYVNINKSRLKFMNFRQAMDNIEILQIDPVISKNLAAEIRSQILTDQLSEENSFLLPMIRRAVANLVAASEIDPRFKITGDHYLAECRKILDAAPDNYPQYRDSIYIAEKTYQKFDNSEDNGFFVAGQ